MYCGIVFQCLYLEPYVLKIGKVNAGLSVQVLAHRDNVRIARGPRANGIDLPGPADKDVLVRPERMDDVNGATDAQEPISAIVAQICTSRNGYDVFKPLSAAIAVQRNDVARAKSVDQRAGLSIYLSRFLYWGQYVALIAVFPMVIVDDLVIGSSDDGDYGGHGGQAGTALEDPEHFENLRFVAQDIVFLVACGKRVHRRGWPSKKREDGQGRENEQQKSRLGRF